ncbi:MAG: hypothetical protein J3Q66DRAFT_404678 [Benniella sp.]|nr:MAG: hypothetical protein J3Q66DRAFT_404678 [Benniella sp.]
MLDISELDDMLSATGSARPNAVCACQQKIARSRYTPPLVRPLVDVSEVRLQYQSARFLENGSRGLPCRTAIPRVTGREAIYASTTIPPIVNPLKVCASDSNLSRPDLLSKVFAAEAEDIPTSNEMHQYLFERCPPDVRELQSIEEAYPGEGHGIQSQVYDRLARLTNLETLWLGSSSNVRQAEGMESNLETTPKDSSNWS